MLLGLGIGRAGALAATRGHVDARIDALVDDLSQEKPHHHIDDLVHVHPRSPDLFLEHIALILWISGVVIVVVVSTASQRAQRRAVFQQPGLAQFLQPRQVACAF